MSGWYALELPSQCRSLIAGTAAAADYLTVAAKLREEFRKGGMLWIQRRVGTADEADAKRYLEVLKENTNDEVRASAQRLLEMLPVTGNG